MKKWIGRIALALAGIVVLIAITGAAYEAVGRRNAARDYPVPGKLVDIGGRRIQLDCRGTGSPTVVFEAGLDMGGSMSWYGVHDSIAKTTRACAYSRAGIMWSDPVSGAQTGKGIAEDLHAALTKSGERPPYVLVAHSLGGPYAMIYTKYFGSDVAGLVFVDASHPDMVTRRRNLTSWTLADATKSLRIPARLSRFGLVRKFAAADSAPPEPAYAVKATAAYASTSLAANLKEVDALNPTLAEAGTLRQLGDRPLFVLTATKPMPATDRVSMKMTPAQGAEYQARWVELQNEEASWSSRSQHQLVHESGHYIQFEKPAIVIAAVRSVIDSSSKGSKALMRSSTYKGTVCGGLLVAFCACRVRPSVQPRPEIDASRQLVVVVTPSWTSTTGTLTRFERSAATEAWTRVDAPIPVVVGRTGLAWGVGFDDVSADGPRKHEGDGKAPAGIFPLDTAFGFAPADSMLQVRLPYVQLLPTTDCVDDTASIHYNAVVDKSRVSSVDWNSAEHMRAIGQYEVGVIVGYNASPPVKGRGSCIFLHIWNGPESHTAGCTAFDETKLRATMQWLDPAKNPLLVQLTGSAYAQVGARYALPQAY